jgi:predicted nuclease with TOPRIM domain
MVGYLLVADFVHHQTMPDTSSALKANGVSEDISAIYNELMSAEKSADVLEGRLANLEQRLDDLIKRLESEETDKKDTTSSS